MHIDVMELVKKVGYYGTKNSKYYLFEKKSYDSESDEAKKANDFIKDIINQKNILSMINCDYDIKLFQIERISPDLDFTDSPNTIFNDQTIEEYVNKFGYNIVQELDIEEKQKNI